MSFRTTPESLEEHIAYIYELLRRLRQPILLPTIIEEIISGQQPDCSCCPCPIKIRICQPGVVEECPFDSTVIDFSPLAYWPLNELNLHPDDDSFDPGVTGQITHDVTGNGYDGTYQRGLLEQGTLVGCGGSYSIFSSNGKFAIADAILGTEWDFNDFTVMEVIQTTDTSNQDHRLLNRDRSNNEQLWTTGLQQNTQHPYFYTRPENTTLFGPDDLADGVTHILFFRRDVTGEGKRSIWVDGVKVAEDATVAGTMEPTTNNVVFGAYILTGQNQYNGLAQHVAVWDRALTDAEIAELQSNATL